MDYLYLYVPLVMKGTRFQDRVSLFVDIDGFKQHIWSEDVDAYKVQETIRKYADIDFSDFDIYAYIDGSYVRPNGIDQLFEDEDVDILSHNILFIVEDPNLKNVITKFENSASVLKSSGAGAIEVLGDAGHTYRVWNGLENYEAKLSSELAEDFAASFHESFKLSDNEDPNDGLIKKAIDDAYRNGLEAGGSIQDTKRVSINKTIDPIDNTITILPDSDSDPNYNALGSVVVTVECADEEFDTDGISYETTHSIVVEHPTSYLTKATVNLDGIYESIVAALAAI